MSTKITERIRTRFHLGELVMVGNRGMITSARIAGPRELGGYGWVTALRASQIAALAADQGPLQMSLFDQADLPTISHPDHPEEQLIAWRNPALARNGPANASPCSPPPTYSWTEIAAAVRAGRLRGTDQIGLRVGRTVGRQQGRYLSEATTRTDLGCGVLWVWSANAGRHRQGWSSSQRQGRGMQVQPTAVQTDRIWTLPNVVSMIRLATIPVFAWLVLAREADLLAASVLALGGITDYLDGALARRLGQISRLGQLLDPIADRISTITVLVVFLISGIMPVWFVALLVVRDLLLAWQLGRLRRVGITGLPVHFVGKLATFLLLLGFPLVLVGAGSGGLAWAGQVVGWALAVWGAGLYWYGAILYIRQARRILSGSKNQGREIGVPQEPPGLTREAGE